MNTLYLCPSGISILGYLGKERLDIPEEKQKFLLVYREQTKT
ncbi:MAG: hypothetical protein ACE5EA_06550 [Nitrospirota bacterium]